MAKIEPRRIAAFLADPGQCRAVLLYGEDAGLVRERAETLLRTVLGGGLDDPFRMAELSREVAAKPGVLAGEAAAQSLSGGRRVVRLRDAADVHANALKEALATPGQALLVLEAGELTGKSRLRALAETAPEAAAIACYRERGAELAGTIARLLREEGVQADQGALDWLSARLGEDRMLLRREVEKLALYAGEAGRLSEEDAWACIADSSTLDLDEALMAATAGDLGTADRALDTAFAEGAQPVAVLRAALRHVQRLHQASVSGGTAETAHVFWRHRPAFDRALRVWTAEALHGVGAALLEAERRSKSSAFRDADVALARGAVLGIARQAAGFSRRR